MANPRPQILSRDSVALTDEPGVIYDLGRIDVLALRVSGNPAAIRYSPKLEHGGVDWTEWETVRSGGTTADDGSLKGFGVFQMRNAVAGSPSVVTIRGRCTGGAG